MSEQEKEGLNLTPEVKDKAIRGLYMILFFVIGYMGGILILAIGIFQFLYQFIFKNVNANILGFSRSLNRYFFEILQFFTFASDYKPFPFSPWPKSGMQHLSGDKDDRG